MRVLFDWIELNLFQWAEPLFKISLSRFKGRFTPLQGVRIQGKQFIWIYFSCLVFHSFESFFQLLQCKKQRRNKESNLFELPCFHLLLTRFIWISWLLCIWVELHCVASCRVAGLKDHICKNCVLEEEEEEKEDDEDKQEMRRSKRSRDRNRKSWSKDRRQKQQITNQKKTQEEMLRNRWEIND